MALTYSDLVQPIGLLRRDLFPADSESDFTGRVSALMGAGATAAVSVPWPDRQDAAVRAYVYWQAYEAVSERLATTPASLTNPDNQGGYAYTSGQLEVVARLAAKYETEFRGILATVPASSAVPVITPAPTSVPVSVRF